MKLFSHWHETSHLLTRPHWDCVWDSHLTMELCVKLLRTGRPLPAYEDILKLLLPMTSCNSPPPHLVPSPLSHPIRRGGLGTRWGGLLLHIVIQDSVEAVKAGVSWSPPHLAVVTLHNPPNSYLISPCGVGRCSDFAKSRKPPRDIFLLYHFFQTKTTLYFTTPSSMCSCGVGRCSALQKSRKPLRDIFLPYYFPQTNTTLHFTTPFIEYYILLYKY